MRLTTPTGRRMIAGLLLFLAGAITSTATNGFGLQAYLREGAEERVAASEHRTEVQAAAVVHNMAAQLDAAGVSRAKLGETFVVTPETRAEIAAQTQIAKGKLTQGAQSAGRLREDGAHKPGGVD